MELKVLVLNINSGYNEDLKKNCKTLELKGRKEKLFEQICRKLRKDKTLEEIADELEEDAEKIAFICKMAEQLAPDYDSEKLYQLLYSLDKKK